MGKFIKRCLIAAVICIAVGLAASAAGITAGGLTELKEQILKGEWNIRFDGNDIPEVNPFYDIETPEYFADGVEVLEGEELIERVYDADEIREIQVKGGGITIEFLLHDDSDVEVCATKSGEFQAFLREGELQVVATGQSNQDIGDGLVQIKLPAALYDAGNLDVTVEASAAVIRLGQMHAVEMDLELSAGTIAWEALLVKELEINMTAGTVEGGNVVVLENTDIDVKAGNVVIAGTFGKEVEVSVSAGKVELQCTEPFQGYNYDLSCAGGSIKVGSEKLEGLAQRKEIGHQAAKDMDIECSAGAVEVQFAE